MREWNIILLVDRLWSDNKSIELNSTQTQAIVYIVLKRRKGELFI